MQTILQDDEYVSISSANLNQRSLDGSRDTELGMGSWQPAYTLANAKQSSDGGGIAASTHSIHTSSPVNASYGKDSSSKGSVPSAAGHGGVINSPDGTLGNADKLANGDGREMGGGSSNGYAASQNADNRGFEQRQSGFVDGCIAGPGVDTSRQIGGAPAVGAITEQPPSETWGQAQLASERQSASAGKQQDQGDLQNAQAFAQSAWQAQGRGHGEASEGQGNGENSGWQQGQRQPQDQGQKQGSGPGHIQTNEQEGVGRNESGHVAFPKGEVYGYRMALWLEHLGGKHDPVYDQPQSLACVKRVNYLAEQNWLQFSGEEECDMTGHLITFPIVVDRSGAVSARTKNGHFSDIDNTIKGKKQPIPALFLN